MIPRYGKPEFNLERTLESTGHSEDLIRRLVNKGEHSEQIHDTIQRNVDHIKIVLGRDQVSSSGSPRLISFQEVIEIGEDFINN